MSARPTRIQPRGQPLFVLALILGSWIILRVLLWQPLFGPQGLVPMRRYASDSVRTTGSPVQPAALPAIPGPLDSPNARPLPPPWPAAALMDVGRFPASPSSSRPPVSEIVGQQLLLAAAFAQVAMPQEIAAYLAADLPVRNLAGQKPLLGRTLGDPKSRWSGDAWSFWRREAGGPLALGQPSYGRSQAGAVLRYRLAPSSGHRPVAYARASRALAGPAETELAAGLAARPAARLPISVAGELRVTDGPAGREVRPAAFAVTELPPAELPAGLLAEAYAQAGYVGGRFATAFVDGQVVVDMRLAQVGSEGAVRAGGGVWGGAQKNAERLDVGPSAKVTFPLGGAPTRLAIDYRVRVAGDAAPKSGPALTFSAGF